MQTRSLVILAVTIVSLASPLAAQRDHAAQRDRALPPYRMGLEHLRAEAWDEAVAAFRGAINIDPAFELAYYGLGRAHMARRAYADAVTALAKCRDLYAAHSGRRFSNAPEAQRYRKDQMMEIDEIIRQYQSGPQSMRSSEVVRQLNERKRQLQETINRDGSCAIENTVPSYVSLSLGSAYFRLGRIVDAEREYHATVLSDPRAGEAHSNLAVVYLQTGRYSEAERAVKAAEKAGFTVHPGLKDDIKQKKAGGSL